MTVTVTEKNMKRAPVRHVKEGLANGMQPCESNRYLYLEYATKFLPISRPKFIEPIQAFNRFCAHVLSYVTSVDICACFDHETRADWSSPDDVKHLMDYHPLVGWKLFPGPITIAMRLLGVRPIKSSAWRQRQKHYWIARLVRALYFLTSFHLLVNIYFQYCYDFDQIKLINVKNKLRDKQRDHGNTTQLELYEDLLTTRLRETKTTLDLIGAPNSNLGITVQCLYLYAIVIGILFYYMGPVFYGVLTQFDLHVCRELLSEENEKRHFDKLIRTLVDKYIESNRMFTLVFARKNFNSNNLATNSSTIVEETSEFHRIPLILDHVGGRNQFSNQQAETDRAGEAQQQQHEVDSRWRLHKSTIARLRQDHFDTRLNLNLMLSIGALKPSNKAPAYMARRSLVMTAYHVGILFYVIVLILSINYLSLSHRDPARPFDLPDYLFLISLSGLFIIIGITANLYTTYFFAASLDEIVAANNINKLIFKCIQVNSSNFAALYQQDQEQQQQKTNRSLASARSTDCNSIFTTSLRISEAAPEESKGVWRPVSGSRDCVPTIGGQTYTLSHCGDIMNTNLLFVLMQYKIFVAQYLPMRRTCKSFIVYATIFSMTIPILLRINLAYMNALSVQNIKTFAIIWSFGSIILADCNIIPICHLYSCCTNLYRALSSLSAHVATIECHPQGKGLYNRHAVSTLIKELEDPNRLLGQFKAGSLGMTCTFTTLVKTHFWWGLIVLSILADEQFNGQGFLGAIFRDPFGAL